MRLPNTPFLSALVASLSLATALALPSPNLSNHPKHLILPYISSANTTSPFTRPSFATFSFNAYIPSDPSSGQRAWITFDLLPVESEFYWTCSYMAPEGESFISSPSTPEEASSASDDDNDDDDTFHFCSYGFEEMKQHGAPAWTFGFRVGEEFGGIVIKKEWECEGRNVTGFATQATNWVEGKGENATATKDGTFYVRLEEWDFEITRLEGRE